MLVDKQHLSVWTSAETYTIQARQVQVNTRLANSQNHANVIRSLFSVEI